MGVVNCNPSFTNVIVLSWCTVVFVLSFFSDSDMLAVLSSLLVLSVVTLFLPQLSCISCPVARSCPVLAFIFGFNRRSNCRDVDPLSAEIGELERRLELASVILVISVLVILLTAPLGAVAVTLAGPRLLAASSPPGKPEKDEIA
jgi:hypothetical protein